MRIHRTDHRLVRTFRGGSRTLTLLLCAITWRGPLPCLHIHDVVAADTGASAELVRHVRAYHSDSGDQADAHWHIHLLLPWRIFHDDERADGRDAPEDPLLAQQTIVHRTGPDAAGVTALLALPLGFASLTGSVLHCLSPCDKEGATGSQGVQGDTSFLATILRAAPLCAVTGVALL